MNLEKFKSLSFKEKLNWIWEYYAVTIVVAIVAVVVCAFLVISMLGIRDNQQISLNVLVLDDRMNQDSAARLEEALSSVIDGNIEISFYSKSNSDQFQAFVVRTAVDGPDIVIAPLNELSEMADNEYVEKNYVMLDSDSFYADAINIGEMYEKYEDVYISIAKRGRNSDNSVKVWERYVLDE